MQRHRDLLRGEEPAAHLHRERHVEHEDGGRARELLRAFDLEVLGPDVHRRARTLPGDRVADRAADVEVERVAELVRLVLVGALVAGARAFDLVPARAVLQQAPEEIPERALADAADALRCQLHAPFALLDEAGLFELLRKARELVERARRIVAEQLAGLVEVDLGELTGIGRVAEHVLQRVDVTELVEHAAHLTERHRLVAAERHALAPTHLRERVAQVLPELVDLPAQVHVVEQRIGELLQLRALLGTHRVEHLLHLRHRTRHRLQQLVEVLRVVREEVAVALHEPIEVGLFAPLALLEHLVQLGEHVLHALELLG